jgi:hypothetical protein
MRLGVTDRLEHIYYRDENEQFMCVFKQRRVIEF